MGGFIGLIGLYNGVTNKKKPRYERFGKAIVWLFGTTLLLREDGDLQWFAAEDIIAAKVENPTFCTWVKSREMIWAITDGEGQPVAMPVDRLNQVWHDYGKTIEKHF